MTNRAQTITISVLCGSCLVLLGVGFFFIVKKSTISQYNKTVRTASEAYRSGNYKVAMVHLKYLKDSLGNTSDELKLNMAHAGFLISRMNSTNNVVRDITGNKLSTSLTDTLDAAADMNYYKEVATTSTNNDLSSIAYNQMGIMAYNLIHANLGEPEEVINEALGYFKAAIKKQPSNYFARYNYELLKRTKEYPDQVMREVRSLINQRKYTLARAVLVNAMERDPSIEKKNPDFLKRLDDVIKINGND